MSPRDFRRAVSSAFVTIAKCAALALLAAVVGAGALFALIHAAAGPAGHPANPIGLALVAAVVVALLWCGLAD